MRAAVEHLRQANALVVLDCCEHVLGAARGAAEALLRGCPFVTVLATSRSPLDADGELVWPVPALCVRRPAEAGALRLRNVSLMSVRRRGALLALANKLMAVRHISPAAPMNTTR